MPGLHLRRGQSHSRTMVNAIEGNLLDARRDVLEAVDKQRS